MVVVVGAEAAGVVVGVGVVVGAGGVVVVAVAGGDAAGGRFGYCGESQHELESAFAPLWGTWPKVIAIRPPARYAGERSISGP